MEAKLPVGQTAALAIHFGVKNGLSLFLYLAQYMLITLIVELVLLLKISPDLATVGFVFDYVVGTYAWCPIAIAIHRRILADEPLRPASYFGSLSGSRTVRFFAYSIVFAGVAFSTIRIAYLIFGIENPLGGLAVLLSAFIAVAFLIRLALVFPAIALEEHASLANAWQLLSGSTWRLIWATVLVSLPLILAEVIAARFMSGWTFDFLERIVGALVGWLSIAVVSYTYSFVNRR